MLSGLGDESGESSQHTVECLDALLRVGVWEVL